MPSHFAGYGINFLLVLYIVVDSMHDAVSRYILGGKLQPPAAMLHPKEDSFYN